MSASLRLLLMHPAFDRIAQAPGVITATVVTAAAVVVIMNHIIPEEVVLAADTVGAAPGDLVPVTHRNHDHPDNTTINHDPTEGIHLATEAGLDTREDVIAANPILQIVNISGILQSL